MTTVYGFIEFFLRLKIMLYTVGDHTAWGEVIGLSHTLLLVDDEVKVLEFMAPFLRQEGFLIITAKNGKEALQKAREKKPSLVVLDWMMPEMSGIEVCRELRRIGTFGIIMVTARAEETDKIIGLEVGADDYMTKPFSLRELAARIRSVLRRMEGKEQEQEAQVLERGELSISEAHCRVSKRGEELPLTPTEFKLLLTLAAKPGIVYSRLQLLQAALEDDILNDERTVDAHISRLRKKVEDDPSAPVYIHTVYGFGYRFGDRL
jgi:DNA-binding response OmpR family regulator